MAASHPADPHVTATPAGDTHDSPTRRGWIAWYTVKDLVTSIVFSLVATAGIVVLAVILMVLFPQTAQTKTDGVTSLLLVSTTIVVTVILITSFLQIRSLLRQKAQRRNEDRLKMIHQSLYTQVSNELDKALHNKIAS